MIKRETIDLFCVASKNSRTRLEGFPLTLSMEMRDLNIWAMSPLTVPPVHFVDWEVPVGFLAGSDERFDGLYEEFYPHQTVLSGFRQKLMRTICCCGHRDQLLQLLQKEIKN